MTLGGRRIDTDAVRRDDRLLDRTADDQLSHADDRLARLLAAARDDIQAEELGPGDGALLVVNVKPSPSRRRLLTAVTVAAAAVLTTSTLASVSYRAAPNSPLWPLTQVLFQQQTKVALAQDFIDRARLAAAQQRYDDARRDLAQARQIIAQLDSAAEAQRLTHEADVVAAGLVDKPQAANAEPPVSSGAVQDSGTIPGKPVASGTTIPAPPSPTPPATTAHDPAPHNQGQPRPDQVPAITPPHPEQSSRPVDEKS